MNKCPRCFAEISKSMKACPKCGLPVNKMEEYAKKFNISGCDCAEEAPQADLQGEALSPKEAKRKLKQEKKEAKREERKQRKIRESKSDTNFTEMAANSGNPDENVVNENDNFLTKRRKRKNKKEKPIFEVDENGEIKIETADVEIVGEQIGKKIDEQFEQSYSVKKARGDYKPPKIKWWEIYKLADRHFARKKIKKEVNKAAKIKPSFIKKSKLLLLAIFLGWMGAHNFYAKNKRKGWVSLICFAIFIFFFEMSNYNTPLASISLFVGGLTGFIALVIWIYDVINIIFNRFKYRLQIDAFIESMNVETRAKLGNKYIDMEFYYKPWWYKLKVNCKKLKRKFDEYRHDSRQRKIAKKRAKLEANQERSSEIEPANEQTETANDAVGAEAKVKQTTAAKTSGAVAGNSSKPAQEESSSSKDAEKPLDFVDQKTLDELKSFSGEENEFNTALTDEIEAKKSTPKKHVNVPQKKYSKTQKNKKAESKKRNKKK